ncbi:nuclease-related domain-containing protein [Rathayibacter sp. VKM Ac-2630]|uniref:nuclease-related domain-containing protein n=1 Tax=Rathayibacter sp. VKM Ac-2630 TaxID=1938617 RepID=UPI0009822A29|nr:nuclease-related domain-containing protein [Rathayibacter sp. VKM Ac-2630]OOB90147.1 hypothetical protein B0T42_13420 [Rathayibacter sp. VKM Ac-2630]
MSDSSLVTRVPGEALMQALRDAMSPEQPQTSAARLFGASPIPTTARSWYTGLLGELAVADELRSLPEGWLVLHSVPVGDRGSDIDHVLVSPAGRVLTVNTKHSPGGRVWVSPKAFLVNGQRRPYLRNSGHEASRAARLLSTATGGSVDVLAVIVVVGAKLTRKGTPEGVAVITLRELSAFLARNAPRPTARSRPSSCATRSSSRGPGRAAARHRSSRPITSCGSSTSATASAPPLGAGTPGCSRRSAALSASPSQRSVWWSRR